MKKTITIILSALLALSAVSAQVKTNGGKSQVDGIAEFDKTVHDFGDVMTTDGPLSCTFTVKNISSKPIAILNVVTSCGCTNVKWTREPLQPGKTGTISATYSNDEGAYPFDKNLTVYITGVKKPIILRLRGVAHTKKLALAELYPIHFGNLGIKAVDFKCGNLSQGSQRSDEINIANIGNSPIKVEMKDVTSGISVKVEPNPIPANTTAKLTYTITTDRSKWGKNYYYMTPVVNGKPCKATVTDGSSKKTSTVSKIDVWAFTKEDFSNLTKEQKENGAQPMFSESTFSFGSIKAGTPVDATFEFKNEGKSQFKAYKVDSDNPKVTNTAVPSLKPGEKGSFKVHLDTTGMPKGEVLVVITITTNSPLRPIVNLFLAGAIS